MADSFIRIQGVVVDAAGDPVFNAHVFQRIVNQGNVGVATSLDGVYSFDAVRNMPVHITHVSYVPEQFTADTEAVQVHELETAGYEIPEVEIEGSSPFRFPWAYAGAALALLALFAMSDDD